MLMNPTETFDNVKTNAIHSNDDNELSGDDDAQTSTHIPMLMTLQTTISAGASSTTTPATNTMASIVEQQHSNRLFGATDGMRDFTVPNVSMDTLQNGNSSTINVSIAHSLTNINSSMTLSQENNRNSSNISFNNIKFTTMKPCKLLSQHYTFHVIILLSSVNYY